METLKKLHSFAERILDKASDVQMEIDSIREVEAMMNFISKTADRDVEILEAEKRKIIESYKRVLMQIIESI